MAPDAIKKTFDIRELFQYTLCLFYKYLHKKTLLSKKKKNGLKTPKKSISIPIPRALVSSSKSTRLDPLITSYLSVRFCTHGCDDGVCHMTCTNFGTWSCHVTYHEMRIAVRVIHQLDLETVDWLGGQHAQVHAEVPVTAVDIVNVCFDNDGIILKIILKLCLDHR